MTNILAVGIATLDIINTVDSYPAENAEVRALSQRCCRGGNAANTLTVLQQLGNQCSWLGVLSNEPSSALIHNDFTRSGINYQSAYLYDGGKTPTSYVTLNKKNGSRTIVHHRDLPEFSFESFKAVDLTPYDWIHFEGRNVAETVKMVLHANTCAPNTPISIEIEKQRPGIEELFPLANYLIFSHDYAVQQGLEQPEELLYTVRQAAENTHIISTWGETGAYALNVDGTLHHSISFPPPIIVDTLGAGDTFNAGLIHALSNHHDLGSALIEACRLAGKKCGIEGFQPLN